jgi:hypothetical protein
MLIVDKRKKNVGQEVLNKTQKLIKTGRYYIRLFITQWVDETVVVDTFGVKHGRFENLLRAELWIRDFEKRTKVRVIRYLHCAS